MEDIEFAIDTALSWEGRFPKIGPGDLVVEIMSPFGDYPIILVSRRYTEPDVDEAAVIAVDAWVERNPDLPSGFVFGGPFYHVRVWPAEDGGDRNAIRGIVHQDDGDWSFEPAPN